MTRRALLGALGAGVAIPALARAREAIPHAASKRLFLCGDVMLGRGVDQIQRHPSSPELYERFADSSLDYVALAESAHGPLPRRVDPSYVWGDALSELERMQPIARIANLETAVTTSGSAWPSKGIHYRMHPRNVAVLRAAGIDCCALANNHVLDWGREGLRETLEVLRAAGIRTAGAGLELDAAAAPAVLPAGGSARILVFGLATSDCGVPRDWAARTDRAGVMLLPELTRAAAAELGARIELHKRSGDLVVASIHWGANWGYEITPAQRELAHALIELAHVDVVHGHSSHHPKGIEVFRQRLILYGCGDLIDDYEGIGGHERFRPELRLLCFADLEPESGALIRLEMQAVRVRRFRIERAPHEGASWLAATLDRESRALGSRVRLAHSDRIVLEA